MVEQRTSLLVLPSLKPPKLNNEVGWMYGATLVQHEVLILRLNAEGREVSRTLGLVRLQKPSTRIACSLFTTQSARTEGTDGYGFPPRLALVF